MDFDSIISIFLIFIFFVLPTILKRMKKKSAARPVQKKTSIFERMGEQVRQFVSEIEQQAIQEKNKGKNQGNIWEVLGEDEKTDRISGSLDKLKTLVNEKRTVIEVKESDPQRRTVPPVPPNLFGTKETAMAGKRGVNHRPGSYGRIPRQELKQAFVWSEILSKPVGLRGIMSSPQQF